MTQSLMREFHHTSYDQVAQGYDECISDVMTMMCDM